MIRPLESQTNGLLGKRCPFSKGIGRGEICQCTTKHPGDRQFDRLPCQLIESYKGNNQDRTSVLPFMAGGGVEADEPEVTSLHYRSSLPTGLASSQA